MQLRLRIYTIVSFVLFIVLISRFFYWQIIRSKDLSDEVRPQHEKKSIEVAYRGKILASDGTVLVGQADSWNLFAEPKRMINSNSDAEKLSQLLVEDVYDTKMLGEEVRRIESLVSDKNKSWVPLKNRLTTEVKDQIEAQKIEGIGFDRDEVRVYPEASAAAQLLGFLGKNDISENQGYFGIEGFYHTTLSASYGIEKRETDLRGLPILFGQSKSVPSYSGADLVTYIDKGVQLMAEEELKNGVEKYGAVNGSVVVIDPSTGGVLAMASVPSFDPRKYWEYANDLFLNPVISASFEPGSVFKIITMAAGLDSNAIDVDTKCDICSGPLRMGEYTIHTWNDQYFPESSMTDIIVHSDNVGMVFVAQKTGIDKNLQYLEKFGLGKKTEIDLQGEMTPQLRKEKDWKEIDLATSSFGQGIAVTPIQMISAVNVIANDGVSIKPKVVKQITVGDKVYTVQDSETGHRVISKNTADEITQMMVEAAKYGESKWTYKRGYGVAGKTGTAQIPISGHYDAEKTVASFVGFAPYRNPKFIMLVTLREPKSSQWASETAAPLWYNIAERLFLHFGITPQPEYN